MRKYLLLLMLIFMVGATTIFSACGKEKKVSITIVNETVAEFTFDKEEYVVGDTATFSVTIDEKYSQSNFTVYANDELLVKDGNGKYSYVLDAENVSFEVKDYSLNTYTYSFDAADFELTTLQVSNITHGESFSFYISTIKYESYVVKVNGVVINPNNGEYVVSNVTSNLNITIEDKVVDTYNVTFDVCEGVGILEYEVLLGTTVNYGDSITFNIQLATGYEKDNFEVKANNVILPYDNGYTVSNITSDTTIVITGAKKKTYNIVFENTTGITGVANTTVNHGDNFTFTFDIADNYCITDDFGMLVNGIPTIFLDDPIEFPYQFEQMIVTEDITISFRGVELDSYAVNYNIPTGVSITGDDFVTHGEDYTFTIGLDTGYKIASTFDILVNGTSIYQTDVFTYTINNVTSDMDIEIIGVQIKTYTITFENVNGIMGVSNTTKEHGSSYTFTFALHDGFVLASDFNIIVKIGFMPEGVNIYESGSFSYTIENIVDDIVITFGNLEREILTVSYAGIEGVNIVNNGTSVVYGDGYTFTYSIKDHYHTTGQFDILVNGVSIYTIGEYTYSFAPIQNTIITFVGVELDTYPVSMHELTGLLIVGDLFVTHGENYTFSFALVDYYKLLPEFDVKVNGTSVYQSGVYEYTIENVSSALDITFSGVALVSYKIDYTLNIDDSCTVVLSDDQVEHGGSYTMTITANTGYDIGNLVARVISSMTYDDCSVVRNNGSVVITVSGVKCNQTVEITGVEALPQGFKIVSLPVGLEYVLLITSVPYGNGIGCENVELTDNDDIMIEIIGPSEGYKLDDTMFDIIVTGADVFCEEQGVIYTISNFTGNISIQVQGVYAENEYIPVYEISDDYTIVFKDNKMVYRINEYITFDINVIGDYAEMKVLVNDTTMVYTPDIGYKFQVKDGMENKIIITVIITR